MLPKGFVYLDEALPGIRWDAKYAGSDNFIGRPIDGYFANRIVFHESLVSPLAQAQALFAEKGLALFVFDAYRPARAVRDFCRWVNAPEEDARKSIHYPNIDKKDMLALGYIAEKSGHSRGCTIDLTLTRNGEPLDMGGIFDFMDELSHTENPGVSPLQRENRLLLREGMLACGFTDYACEWWHFRLKNEAFPDEYFDFPIDGGDTNG